MNKIRLHRSSFEIEQTYRSVVTQLHRERKDVGYASRRIWSNHQPLNLVEVRMSRLGR